jgi:flavorubredoxin
LEISHNSSTIHADCLKPDFFHRLCFVFRTCIQYMLELMPDVNRKLVVNSCSQLWKKQPYQTLSSYLAWRKSSEYDVQWRFCVCSWLLK